MLLNSIYGNYGNGCTTCGGTLYANNQGTCSTCGNGNGACGCGCGNYGSNLGNAAYNFIGEWVNIVVTLTILQSILGLVCNWNCGSGSC